LKVFPNLLLPLTRYLNPKNNHNNNLYQPGFPLKIIISLNYIITNLFTLWIILFAIITFYFPEHFTGLSNLIVPTLGIIMFGMGMTLTVEDFGRVLKRPKDIGTGVLLQCLVMPFAAFILVKLFNLDQFLAVGVILLGSCPGGTASNVITYLARERLQSELRIQKVYIQVHQSIHLHTDTSITE